LLTGLHDYRPVSLAGCFQFERPATIDSLRFLPCAAIDIQPADLQRLSSGGNIEFHLAAVWEIDGVLPARFGQAIGRVRRAVAEQIIARLASEDVHRVSQPAGTADVSLSQQGRGLHW
jgi:hypothetical protein